MGISGLLPALKNIIEPQHVRKYAGQKVAVDTVSPHPNSAPAFFHALFSFCLVWSWGMRWCKIAHEFICAMHASESSCCPRVYSLTIDVGFIKIFWVITGIFPVFTCSFSLLVRLSVRQDDDTAF